MKHRKCFIIGLILAFATKSYGNHCDRTPEKAAKPANKVDTNRYIIEISGNPKSYVPGENYTINLKLNPSQPKNYHSFTEFTLVVEPENPSGSFQTAATGDFHLIDGMLTKFDYKCRNTVVQTNTVAKTSINVSWIAPPEKSGCIAIKATVFESRDSWFSDDGELTKVLCEENSENEDIQPPTLKYCCACDEAKYEVAFQGMWSRNTHPKDFPKNLWNTKFSDVIGASHKLFKSFWNYGGMASEGLKLLAEEGDTKLLETELKEMSDDIRTIIKARELSYPNNTGTSYTVFRVDRENHVISLVSKITPSPDWIVGVANLELCLRNCSWAESRTLNLYPWDVGTDDGLSYNSPDSPSIPLQPVRMIKSNNPNREESPFYSEDGEPIKPLAKLHLIRQKLYEKVCDSNEIMGSNEEIDPNCATSKWSQWSPCSDICFQFRQRSYINPTASKNCQQSLVESVPCTGPRNCQNQPRIDEGDDRCQIGDWSPWSSCSVSCGKGVKTRDRQFLSPAFRNICSRNGSPTLQETEECEGSSEDCETDAEASTGDCTNTIWGDWTPCSVTCGNGTKERFRVNKNEEENDEERDEEETEPCGDYKEIVDCYNSECEENNDPSFGEMRTENQIVVVAEGPNGPVVDCKVSKWSIWSRCNSSEPCKKQYKFKNRHIIIHPQNGGKACPRKLMKKKRCKTRCPKDEEDSRETHPTWGPSQPTEAKIDCVMGPWSNWSPCSTICGGSAVQQRTRGILVPPSKNGRPCKLRKEEKICPLPLACTDRGALPSYL